MSRLRGCVAAGLVAVLALAGCSTDGDDGPDGPDSKAGASPRSSEAASESPTATPRPDLRPDLRYVALGDSFTAAPGVGKQVGPAGCLRTDANYPHLVQERLGLELVDVSCSGATSADLTSPQAAAGAGVTAQLDALTPQTDLVTLSMGGNDGGLYASFVSLCADVQGDGAQGRGLCRDNPRFAPDALDEEMADLRRRTAASVAAVQERAPQAQVVVVGYPQVVPVGESCHQLPMVDDDVAFARSVNRRLAGALKGGAKAAGVPYVDAWRLSEGHDACSEDPWVAGLRPERPGFPVHPYAELHVAIADAVAGLVADD
ncbi:SGNH/GDSL hydrolase family protein [Nocardioides sp. zg-ZUI104]|uniref:SGNH/GDSL hydrolase family protein n=1 Tax=Nocardioides faecalis TaxID=2803858 RepID=UPI001BCC98C1|nr:SGNH/GDSL hydrolase family protein [Nocardioides faecalis]MBS4752881.1 SGNH/GDSL hydrolase family protein [Nocardioides faecalis]